MELRIPSVWLTLVGIILIALFGKAKPKSVWTNPQITKADMKEMGCTCRVETAQGKLLYEQTENYPWPPEDCKYVHQRCRNMCANSLDLQSYITYEGDNTVKTKRGVYYCKAYGGSTDNTGVTLHGTWTTTGCPHNPYHKVTLRTVSLCCGHSPIKGANGKSYSALGYNPDCKAKEIDF